VEGTLKGITKRMDDILTDLECLMAPAPKSLREISLARTRLQEAKMWLGQALGVEVSDFRD
jgi:hypothetical protein